MHDDETHAADATDGAVPPGPRPEDFLRPGPVPSASPSAPVAPTGGPAGWHGPSVPPYPTFPPYAPPSVPAPRRHGAAVAVGIVAAVVVGALALGLGVTALTDLTRENAGTTMEGVDAEDAWYVEDLDSSGLWVEDLRAGDCFFDGPLDGPWSGPDEPSAGWQVDVVDCDDEHPMEVVGDFELTGDRPPRADEDFFLATEDRCWSILEDYAAPGALTDDLWVDFYWPSRESWREGDRLVTCVAATSRLRTGSIVRDAAST